MESTADGVAAYVGHSLPVNMQGVATGSTVYNAWADKLTLLEYFNGYAFNTVPAANDEAWRLAA